MTVSRPFAPKLISHLCMGKIFPSFGFQMADDCLVEVNAVLRQKSNQANSCILSPSLQTRRASALCFLPPFFGIAPTANPGTCADLTFGSKI